VHRYLASEPPPVDGINQLKLNVHIMSTIYKSFVDIPLTVVEFGLSPLSSLFAEAGKGARALAGAAHIQEALWAHARANDKGRKSRVGMIADPAASHRE